MKIKTNFDRFFFSFNEKKKNEMVIFIFLKKCFSDENYCSLIGKKIKKKGNWDGL